MNTKKRKSKKSISFDCNKSLSKRLLSYIGLLLLAFQSCNSDYSPKPIGHLQIELEQPEYLLLSDYSQFEFRRAAITEIEKEENNSKDAVWFNILYPTFNARIYCNYLPVNNNLKEIMEDCDHFSDLHIHRAESYKEYRFEDIEQGIYGLVYKLKGKNPSPTQFILTDSVHAFFRGALYFDTAINQDSITPILEYLNKDIEVLIESFRWKKK